MYCWRWAPSANLLPEEWAWRNARHFPAMMAMGKERPLYIQEAVVTVVGGLGQDLVRKSGKHICQDSLVNLRIEIQCFFVSAVCHLLYNFVHRLIGVFQVTICFLRNGAFFCSKQPKAANTLIIINPFLLSKVKSPYCKGNTRKQEVQLHKLSCS